VKSSERERDPFDCLCYRIRSGPPFYASARVGKVEAPPISCTSNPWTACPHRRDGGLGSQRPIGVRDHRTRDTPGESIGEAFGGRSTWKNFGIDSLQSIPPSRPRGRTPSNPRRTAAKATLHLVVFGCRAPGLRPSVETISARGPRSGGAASLAEADRARDRPPGDARLCTPEAPRVRAASVSLREGSRDLPRASSDRTLESPPP